MKRLSLLKPYVHTAVLQNQIAEKVKYLNIPTRIDEQALAADIKMGAKQFTELDKLVKKRRSHSIF